MLAINRGVLTAASPRSSDIRRKRFNTVKFALSRLLFRADLLASDTKKFTCLKKKMQSTSLLGIVVASASFPFFDIDLGVNRCWLIRHRSLWNPSAVISKLVIESPLILFKIVDEGCTCTCSISTEPQKPSRPCRYVLYFLNQCLETAR